MSSPELRHDASMTLLREVMERPLDPAYAEAHERKLANPEVVTSRQWFQEIIVLILTVAIGMGGVWAARQLRAPVEGALRARTVLEEQITDRSRITASLQEEISDLRTEIQDLESTMNTPATAAIRREADMATLQAGTVPVNGSGVILTLTDPSSQESPDEIVLDFDLQIVANALWAAGAEAISINGYRLAYGTAIRTAGEVILVDLQPLQSPYEVQAIGDPEILSTGFASTTAAEHLKILSSAYQISSSITQASHLELQAGNSMKLEHAEPISF